MKIIYPNGVGGIAVVNPTGETTIEAVVSKDVPQGVPYLFVEDGAIPSDRTYREAWEADFSDPDGYGGQK